MTTAVITSDRAYPGGTALHTVTLKGQNINAVKQSDLKKNSFNEYVKILVRERVRGVGLP